MPIPNSKTIKVIIVDDHEFYRKTLRLILGEIPNCQIVGEAADGIEFLELAQTVVADIIFMDIRMPRLNGIEATLEAGRRYRDINIVGLTMFEEKEYFMQMIYAGAKGFLLKDTDREEFAKAIETVLEGRHYYSKALSELLKKDK